MASRSSRCVSRSFSLPVIPMTTPSCCRERVLIPSFAALVLLAFRLRASISCMTNVFVVTSGRSLGPFLICEIRSKNSGTCSATHFVLAGRLSTYSRKSNGMGSFFSVTLHGLFDCLLGARIFQSFSHLPSDPLKFRASISFLFFLGVSCRQLYLGSRNFLPCRGFPFGC